MLRSTTAAVPSVGSADVSFTLTGDLITSGDANFLIDNSSGGTIDGNTAINVDAANITANSLLARINNTSGTIGGNANINFNLTGDLHLTAKWQRRAIRTSRSLTPMVE